MDSSLRGDAFPPNDFSSEFQFDCAFGFDGEFDFGFGGNFNFLRAHESGFGGSPLGDDPFEYDGVSIDHSIEDYVAFRRRRRRRIRRTKIAIFELRVSRSPAGTSSFSSLESRVK